MHLPDESHRPLSRLLAWLSLLMALVLQVNGSPLFTLRPVGNAGFDVLADGNVIAPIRLAAEGAIQADNVVTNVSGIQLSGIHTKDPLAVTFAPDDFVSVSLPEAGITNAPTAWAPVVRFK